MATNKQIVKAGEEFREAVEQLQSLKDRKNQLQDQLSSINARINDQQIVVDSLKSALTVVVNEP